MTDTNEIVKTYIAAWNEQDPGRRAELIESTFSEDAEYLDPLMASNGHDGIDAMIAGVQQQYAGHRFELVQGPDSHNDRVRFTWTLVPEGGAEPVATGFDFGTVAEDGRLQSVTGFLEVAAA